MVVTMSNNKVSTTTTKQYLQSLGGLNATSPSISSPGNTSSTESTTSSTKSSTSSTHQKKTKVHRKKSSAKRRIIDESTLSTEDVIKLSKRRQYNRESAARSRERTKKTMETLQKQVQDLHGIADELRTANEKLKADQAKIDKENKQLRLLLQLTATTNNATGNTVSPIGGGGAHRQQQDLILHLYNYVDTSLAPGRLGLDVSVSSQQQQHDNNNVNQNFHQLLLTGGLYNNNNNKPVVTSGISSPTTPTNRQINSIAQLLAAQLRN